MLLFMNSLWYAVLNGLRGEMCYFSVEKLKLNDFLFFTFHAETIFEYDLIIDCHNQNDQTKMFENPH